MTALPPCGHNFGTHPGDCWWVERERVIDAAMEVAANEVEALRVHSISGYEWECSECHYHFAGLPCHITGVVAGHDAEVDSTEREMSGPHDGMLDRSAVLAILRRPR